MAMIDLNEYLNFQFKQPYWVLNAKDYKKRIVNKNGIDHYYTFRFDSDVMSTVVADGCPDIIFRVDEDGGGEAVISSAGNVGTIVSYPKGSRFFGVRLLPGYYYSLGGVAIKEIDIGGVLLTDLISDNSYTERIIKSNDFCEQIGVFEEFFFGSKLLKRTMAIDNALFAQTMAGILLSNGSVSLDSLSRLTLYSESRIRSVFSEYMGTSFKSFESIARYQNLLEHLNYRRNSDVSRLSDIALKTGYYDQAHMIKDFKRYTLESPKRYIKLLDSEKFLEKIHLV